jgi:quercetin dioxygenase-like cupin family protein
MDIANFQNDLKENGYADIETKNLTAGTVTTEHDHPFDVLALVLDGEIALTVAGTTRSYSKGEVFSMAAGCRHAERIGAAGVSYLVGRRSTPLR